MAYPGYPDYPSSTGYPGGPPRDPEAMRRYYKAQHLAAARPTEHVGLFNFRVEIEGLTVGGFRNVEGLELEVEPITYHVSNERMPLKRPGRPKVGNIRLIKGYVNTDTLWRWCEDVRAGNFRRKAGSVVLLNDSGMDVSRYNFFEGWPVKWSGFRFEGKGNDALIEELELAVEKIVRA